MTNPKTINQVAPSQEIETKKILEQNLKQFEIQIHNHQELLKLYWKNLKDTSKNWTKSELVEIVYNIEKEAQCLGKCEVNLENTEKLMKELEKDKGI